LVKVALISDQHYDHVGVPVLPNFLQPAGQVTESVTASDVIDQQGTGSSTVVGASNALKALLPSLEKSMNLTFTYSVPDLEFDVLIVDLDGSCTELDPDSQIVLLPEALVCELEK
jgi:hypothetical protein